MTKKGDKFYNYVNGVVPQSEVAELQTEFKGYKYYHKYTDKQIEAVKHLLVLWHDKYNIPLTYNENIWAVCKDALEGKPGLYTHVSVRNDKSDCWPQPELIAMLKSL